MLNIIIAWLWTAARGSATANEPSAHHNDPTVSSTPTSRLRAVALVVWTIVAVFLVGILEAAGADTWKHIVDLIS